MNSFASLADREEDERKKRMEILDNHSWMKAAQHESYFTGYEEESRIALSARWSNDD